MKRKLPTLISRLQSNSVSKKMVVIPLVAVLTFSAIGTGLFIYGGRSDVEAEETPLSPVEITVESVEVMPEITITEANVYTPKFVSCVISSESVEKDLTIYISDKNDECIKGTQFKVKLIKPEDAKSLEGYIDSIETLNEQIGSSCDDVTEITDENLIQLCQDKEVALQAYDMALNSIEGDTYVDENADGVISLPNMKPGDYTAVLVADSANNSDVQLDPIGYAIPVNVKDKLEYKAVKEIKKKVEVYVATEDVKSQAAVEEKELADTVTYVESSKKDNGSTVETTDVVKPNEKKKYIATVKDGAITSVKVKAVKKVDNVATPTPSVTPTETPSATPAPTDAVAPSDTATPTVAPTDTVTPTEEITAEPTGTVEPTPTETPEYVEEEATLDMSFNGDTFTISATSNVKNIKINGNEISGTTYKVETVGDYTLTGVAESSDGSDTKELTVTYAVTSVPDNAEEQLKDSKGNLLFLDMECTQPATAANYKDGIKLYEKKEDYIYYGWQNINGATYYYDENGNYVTGDQVINGASYTFDSNGVLQNKGTGIDVSKFQGNIDWAQVKSSISYAYIRCGGRYRQTRGLYEDPMFYTNMAGAKAQGIPVGVYFYSTAENEQMAVEEASLAVAMANNAGGCSLPIYIDMEDAIQSKLSNEQRTNIINAFCSTVANSGYRAGVYASYTWLNSKINVSDIPSSYSIWVARYNSTLGYSGRYNIWQYTSKGSVPGIKGTVDMNRTN